MELVIVFKPDGIPHSIANQSVSLHAHAAELIHIGVRRVFAQEKVPGPLAAVDAQGARSGLVNAFAISREDWVGITDRLVDALGFRVWIGSPFPELKIPEGCYVSSTIPPMPLSLSLGAVPVMAREFIGRPCRLYKQGDGLSGDFKPDRVNIELDQFGRISNIWIG